MKYLVVLCDGMADYPVAELGGKTPLEAADTPNMDALAKKATVGLVKTVQDGMKPGSDVANLSVLGYDPMQYYTGRSPLEAGSIGIDMKPTFRFAAIWLLSAMSRTMKTARFWITVQTIFPQKKRGFSFRLYRKHWGMTRSIFMPAWHTATA